MFAALRRRYPVTPIALVWLACVVGGLLAPRMLTVIDFTEKWLSDLRIATLGPRMERHSDIVLLTITEETLSQYPYRFPIDRGMLAEVLERLDRAGARAIGLDILFDQATEPRKDRRLAAAVAASSAPVVIGWASAADGLTPKQVEFLDGYLPRAVHAPSNLVKGDRDGTVRWIYPGSDTAAGYRRGFAAALAEAVGVKPPDEAIPLFYRRGTDGGVQPFTKFPLHFVTALPKEWFTGKIVLIGADLPNEDRHRTPFAALIGNHKGSIPGLVIHAFALSQLLDGATFIEGGIGLDIVLVGAAGTAGVLLAVMEASILLRILLGLGSVLVLWLGGFGLFSVGGILVPLFVPSATLAAAVGLGAIVTGQRFRQQKEHAEAMVKARSEFLALMSHEIRTPMNGVLGVLELIRGTGLNPDQSRMVTIVQDSASSLLGILNDILDISKIEAGRLEINPEPVSMRRIADGVVATFATAADNKGISIEVSVGPETPDWISADPVRIRQILVNLIGNAIKFTQRGGVTVSCGVLRRPEEDDQLSISVKDTGIGMSPNALETLFTPFTQAEQTTTRRFGGTGLGMSISLQLVEMMNGRIDVESAEGEGSTFTVLLPLIGAEAPEEDDDLALPDLVIKPVGPSQALSELEPAAATGPLILIAEDNPTNQWLIRQQLSKLGYRTEVQPDGRAALEAYRQGDYAMVITDFHMPEMDGPALARAIREGEADGARRVPIAILTANAMPNDLETCNEAGIDDVLIKPTNLKALSRTLIRLIGAADEAGQQPADAPTATVEAESVADGADDGADDGDGAEQVLDLSIFEEIFGGINDMVLESLNEYLVGGATLSDRIEELAGEGDATELAKTAHRLAGESVSAGAAVLGRLCKEMEVAATEDDWTQITDLRPRIREALESVKGAIAAL